MRRILALALAGVFTLAGCSDDDEKSTPTNAAPTVSAAFIGDVTENTVTVAAVAIDPDAGDTITCTWELVSQPSYSRVTLPAASSDCRAAAELNSFVPLLEGTYVVRVSVSDGVHTPATTADVTIPVASRYSGGAVSGTAAAVSAVQNGLIAALKQLPATGGSVLAANVFKAFANITGTTTFTQGAVLTWAERPYDVIDVREPSHFAAGHIPGAINVPLDDLPRVLVGDPRFPGTEADMRKVLVTGYTQGDSSLGAVLVTVARSGLGVIPDGQKAFFLAQGMATWTYDKSVAPMRWDDDLAEGRRFGWKPDDGTGYVVAGAYNKTAQARFTAYPNLTAFNAAAAAAPTKQILLRAAEWLAWARADAETMGVPASEAFVTHWGQYKALKDVGAAPQVLTLQSGTQYPVAHVAGALAIVGGSQPPTSDLNTSDTLKPAELNLYDPSGRIFVQCFTNTGAVQPCFNLGILGYRSRSVLYGISGAVDASLTAAGYNTGFVSGVIDRGAGGSDFPLATGPDSTQPDTAWARPTGTGCAGCHQDFTAHFTAVTLNTTAPPPAVASEGEG